MTLLKSLYAPLEEAAKTLGAAAEAMEEAAKAADAASE